MWCAQQDKAYASRPKHVNHVLPPKRLHERPQLNLDIRMEEVPIVFMFPSVEQEGNQPSSDFHITNPAPNVPLPDVPPKHTMLANRRQSVLLQEQDSPSTPSSAAPQVMTGLLQEVLGIMNEIMDQRSIVQEEYQVLQELTELVVIMQQEAEDLLALADLVEEYNEEVEFAEQAAVMEEWVDDLDLEYYSEEREEFVVEEDESGGLGHRRDDSEEWGEDTEDEKSGGLRHRRDDSAVELDEEDVDHFHFGELAESVYREVPIIRRQTPEIKEVRLVDIEAVGLRGGGQSKFGRVFQNVPIISTPQPREGKLIRPPSIFRDSGLDLLSPKWSVSSKKTIPRWI
jgi:hypothetical protein